MNRTWIHALLLTGVILVLAGCGLTVEEQATSGISKAQTVFSSEPAVSNKSIGNIQLYLPKGYGMEKGIDKSNYTLIDGKDSYILFVNPNETLESRLHYTILKEDPSSEVLQEKTYEADDIFGFSAIVRQPEEKYQLVVNVGGVKLTTISEGKKIDEKLQQMMKVVKSVRVIDEQK